MNFITDKKLNKYKNKTCFLRVDLNVGRGEENSFRTKAVLPTIKLLLKNNIRVIIASHRGRFNGKEGNKPLTMKPFAEIFSKELEKNVEFIPSLDLKKINKTTKESSNDLILIENLRQHKEEQKNDEEFAKNLSNMADFYINDAFAVCHRKNASITKLPKLLPSFGGLLLEKEIKNLKKAIEDYESPFSIVLGGAKVSTKIGVIKNFWNKADQFLLGGGIANTFLFAEGYDMKNSLYEKSAVMNIEKYIGSDKIMLPVDTETGKDGAILDIGEETVQTFSEIINKSKTIIWNGPLGYFEKPEFAKGSKAIAAAIADSDAFSIVGGGETTTLVSDMNLVNEFSFVSTGGGAMLEFLSGNKLPGIEVLK